MGELTPGAACLLIDARHKRLERRRAHTNLRRLERDRDARRAPPTIKARLPRAPNVPRISHARNELTWVFGHGTTAAGGLVRGLFVGGRRSGATAPARPLKRPARKDSLSLRSFTPDGAKSRVVRAMIAICLNFD
jgi:hypothetical protein